MNTNYNPLPIHLAQHDPQGLIIGEPVAQFEIGDYKNFVYLILDWVTHEAAIVDPQFNLSIPLRLLQDHGFKLSAILLTHSHHDHVAGVPELIRKFPLIPIYLHKDDSFRLENLLGSECFHFIKDQDQLKIGNIVVTAFHTPGHSAGEISYLFTSSRSYLLTGDTIFIRDCGRTDFPTGSNEEMFSSIQKIKELPIETIFLPGHHYALECATTLEIELNESPPFRCKNVEELKALP